MSNHPIFSPRTREAAPEGCGRRDWRRSADDYSPENRASKRWVLKHKLRKFEDNIFFATMSNHPIFSPRTREAAPEGCGRRDWRRSADDYSPENRASKRWVLKHKLRKFEIFGDYI